MKHKTACDLQVGNRIWQENGPPAEIEMIVKYGILTPYGEKDMVRLHYTNGYWAKTEASTLVRMAA